MMKFSIAATTQAMTSATISTSQPGIQGIDSWMVTMMDQLVNAPTISTSPWAKLIRLMMP
jgi:hypothetical protein